MTKNKPPPLVGILATPIRRLLYAEDFKLPPPLGLSSSPNGSEALPHTDDGERPLVIGTEVVAQLVASGSNRGTCRHSVAS
jgi:hypothetical protein